VSALELDTDRRGGGLLWIFGGVALSVGTFLPWLTAAAVSGSSFSGSLSRSGFQLGAGNSLSFEGPLCLALGIFAIVMGIARLISKNMPSYLLHAATLSVIAAGVVLADRYPDIHNLVQQLHWQSVFWRPASIGSGFWICCIGVLIPIVGKFVHGAVQLNREFHVRCVERYSFVAGVPLRRR
jgi:hypothetical protein